MVSCVKRMYKKFAALKLRFINMSTLLFLASSGRKSYGELQKHQTNQSGERSKYTMDKIKDERNKKENKGTINNKKTG